MPEGFTHYKDRLHVRTLIGVSRTKILGSFVYFDVLSKPEAQLASSVLQTAHIGSLANTNVGRASEKHVEPPTTGLLTAVLQNAERLRQHTFLGGRRQSWLRGFLVSGTLIPRPKSNPKIKA